MNGILRKWHEHTVNSTDKTKRLHGIERLSESREKSTVDILAPMLDDADAEVRGATAAALGVIGIPAAIEFLVARVLVEHEHDTLEVLMDALTCFKPESVADLLTCALADDDPAVRLAAGRALRHVCWKHLSDETRVRVAVLQDEWVEAVQYGAAAIATLKLVIYEGTPTARRRAAEALSSIGDRAAMEALIEVQNAKEVDSSIAEVAAWGLRRVCWDDVDAHDLVRAAITLRDWQSVVGFGENAVRPLIDAFHIAESADAQSIAGALNEIRSDRALTVLVHWLHDPQIESSLREHIAKLFGARDDDRSLVALVSSLSGSTWSVRVAALGSLEQREWAPKLDVEKALVAIIRNEWEAVTAIGDAAIPALGSCLGSFNIAKDAAKALASLGPTGCDALVRAINRGDNNSTVREIASLVLAEHGDTRAIRPLEAMLEDADIAVRLVAAWTLEQLGWKPTTEAEKVISAMAHGDWDCLSDFPESVVEPLLQMAADTLVHQEASTQADSFHDAPTGRVSIDQLRRSVNLKELIPDFGDRATTALKRKLVTAKVK